MWVELDHLTYRLTIDPPNQISAVGEHAFYINDWLVNLVVKAPCETKNIKGLDGRGSLSIRLDDINILYFEFRQDSDGRSWRTKCGRATKTTIYNAPDFVSFDISEGSILVEPTQKR